MVTEPDETKEGAFLRTWRVLMYLVERSSPATALDISRDLGLAMPTTLRLVGALCSAGLASFNKRGRLYEPGPALFRLVALAGAGGAMQPLIDRALRELSDRTGETACLNLLQPGGAFSIVAKAEGEEALRYVVELGALLPIHLGAGGKAILAFAPESLKQPVLATVPHAKRLEKDLAQTRLRGFATSFGERVKGAVGVAAPVFDVNGDIWGSVQVTLPDHRFSDERLESLSDAVRAAAQTLSAVGQAPGRVA